MSILFRFEDTYGLHLLFQKCAYEILNLTTELNTSKKYKLTEGVYVQNGVGINSMFKLSLKEKDAFESLNVTDVIYVFDLDDFSGNRNTIMTTNSFEHYFQTRGNRRLHEQEKSNWKEWFLPIRWCAETIELPLMCTATFDTAEVVHNTDYKWFLNMILRYYLSCGVSGKIKNLSKYLPSENLQCYIQEVTKTQFSNKLIFNWLSSRNMLSDFQFLNYENTLKYIDESNLLFTKFINQNVVFESTNNVFMFTNPDSLKECVRQKYTQTLTKNSVSPDIGISHQCLRNEFLKKRIDKSNMNLF